MLDISESISFVTGDNLSGFVDLVEREVITSAVESAIDDILQRTVFSSTTYGFTDRSGQLRASIGIQSIDFTRSEITWTLSASAINPKDGYDYARIIEYGYGRRFSYIGRALDESRGIASSFIMANIREAFFKNQRQIKEIFSQRRQKKIFFRDSRGRFAKLPKELV